MAASAVTPTARILRTASAEVDDPEADGARVHTTLAVPTTVVGPVVRQLDE
jgi:hypothetical protein